MERSEAAEGDPAVHAAALFADACDVWVSAARRWSDRAKDKTTWSAEDVVGDHTDLFEHLTPIAERGIDMTIELLRPWAKAIEARRR
jgi:hypothetical protein